MRENGFGVLWSKCVIKSGEIDGGDNADSYGLTGLKGTSCEPVVRLGFCPAESKLVIRHPVGTHGSPVC
jgi:hypothetical protein